MKSYLIGLALLGSIATAQPGPSPGVSKHIEKILSRADGSSQATAYKVSSVHDEYEVLSALRLTLPLARLLPMAPRPLSPITWR